MGETQNRAGQDILQGLFTGTKVNSLSGIQVCHPRSCSLFRGSRDHSDFWTFFKRYQQFTSRNASSSRERSEEGSHGGSGHKKLHKSDQQVSPKFGLPRMYDRSYRIGFSVVPADLGYRLRMVQEKRKEEGKGKSPITERHLTYFRTVLRHFINFQQKRKVC